MVGEHKIAKLDRCPTGIKTLDKLLGGGLVRGSINLLVGEPGTGKTTLTAKFLHEGASRYGEPGLYVGLTEGREEFLAYMERLGMDFLRLEDEGLFKFLGVPAVRTDRSLLDLLDLVLEYADSMSALRLVIDPVTPLLMGLTPLEARTVVHGMLMRSSRMKGLTALMVLDLTPGIDSHHDVLRYLVDGLISLEVAYTRGGVLRRVMRILKMRGLELRRTVFDYEIVPGECIHVAHWLRAPEPPMGGVELLPSYVDGLDKVIGGGLVRGSSNLIIGPPGSGKSKLMLKMAAEQASRGMSVLYFSMTRSRRSMALMLRSLGYDPLDLERKGLRLVYAEPQEMAPARIHMLLSREEELGHGSDFKFVEGIQECLRMLGPDEFHKLVKDVLGYLGGTNVVLVSSIAGDPLSDELASVAELFDLIMWITPIVREREVSRRLVVLRSRLTPASRRVHELVENGGVLRVG